VVAIGCHAKFLGGPYPALHLLYPSLHLEIGPLNTARSLGSVVSSTNEVWGGATAESEFGASD